jgi:molybdenum cofactor biosynthesis protein MoaC
MSRLSHIDETGRAHMVDVGDKSNTDRLAIAKGEVLMRPDTLALVRKGALKKGDVLTVAQLAGIMAAKRTSELIPLCHPIPINHISVDVELTIVDFFQKPVLRAKKSCQVAAGKHVLEMGAFLTKDSKRIRADLRWKPSESAARRREVPAPAILPEACRSNRCT